MFIRKGIEATEDEMSEEVPRPPAEAERAPSGARKRP